MLEGLYQEKTEIESSCHLNDVEFTLYQDEIIKRGWNGIPIIKELKSKGIKLYGSNDDTKITINITGDFKVGIQFDEEKNNF